MALALPAAALPPRLAASQAKPSVLLLEAGGDNNELDWRVGVDRFIQILNPNLTYLYESVPQPQLGGRKVKLERGKGLVALLATTLPYGIPGPGTTGTHWLSLPETRHGNGNASIRDSEVSRTSMGAVPDDLPAGVEKYVNPKPENHSYGGPLRTAFSQSWDPYITSAFEAWEASGYSINPDAGNGHRLGLAVAPTTCYRGTRSTAADLAN